jgi:hypothetical protein
MSNYLAIATVTAALSNLLADAVPDDISGVQISTRRPDDGATDTTARINVFLYQVVPNVGLRNAALPARRADGSLSQRPQVALDLYYLLSFYGDESKQEPQRLLGSAVSALDREPTLTRERIRETISTAQGADPSHYLTQSDLAEQLQRVTISFQAINLEELSKLWSLLVYQAPYALSVTYLASAVLIEGAGTPRPALPIHERKLFGMPFKQPVIESISPSLISAESEITIKGHKLSADRVRVIFAAFSDPVTPTEVSDKSIKVKLPNGLRAGVNSVQVVHELDLGTPSEPHGGFESNVAAFVLRPTITAATATSSQVNISFNPKVGKRQRAVLLLNELNPPQSRSARAYSFNAPRNNGITSDAVEETDTIEFAISHVVAGDYLVRVQVDGAESALERSTDGQFNGPQVTIPS